MLTIACWLIYEPNKGNNKFLFYNFFLYLIILVGYAIFEAITVMNPILDALRSSGVDYPKQGANYVRYGIYRSQSLTIWTDIFGTECACGFLFLFYSYFKGYLKKNIMMIIALCACLIGVFISGTRSVMVILFLGILSCFSFLRSMKFLIFLIPIIFVIIGQTGDYFSQVLESFTNPEEAGGSSVEMRGLQFLVAFKYWMNAPIIGNGLDYTDLLVKNDVGLLGAESIIFKLLIDRGVLGFFSFVFLYAYSFYVLKKKNMVRVFFIPIAFAIGKILSLIFSLEEAYIFSFVILLIKFRDKEYNIRLKLMLFEFFQKQKSLKRIDF